MKPLIYYIPIKLIRLYRYFSGKYSIERVVIFPTLICNLDCSYCSNKWWNGDYPYIKDKISTSEWFKIFSMDFKTVSEIVISGGEPLLYNGIHELVNELAKTKLVFLETNLTPIFDFTSIKDNPNIIFVISHHKEMKITQESNWKKNLETVKKRFRYYIREIGYSTRIANGDNPSDYFNCYYISKIVYYPTGKMNMTIHNMYKDIFNT